MEIERSPKQYFKKFEIKIEYRYDPKNQLHLTIKDSSDILKSELAKLKGIKITIVLKITFAKTSQENTTYKSAYFQSKASIITNISEINDTLKHDFDEIINKIGNWISEGSGWRIESVDAHYLNRYKYSPLAASSYIKLPKELQHPMKGLINIKNDDNECFRWCHLAFKFPVVNNPQRVSKYKKHIEKLDYSGIKFPITINQVPKIEVQNNITFNIFGYENEKVYPLYRSKYDYSDKCDMLLINKGNTNHYVWIKDFNRLMYNKTKHANRKHFCKFCLQCFSQERILNSHIPRCLVINGTQAVEMPEEGSKVHFKNYHKQLMAPFVIYADFESITKKVLTALPSEKNSFTEPYQKHIDCGYGYKVVCCYDDKYTKPAQVYRGPNAVYKFIEAILKEEEYCKGTMEKYFKKPLRMSKKDEALFKNQTSCHICGKEYTIYDIPVRDHCHITGKFRGSAHPKCNINFRLTSKIPVIFHNLRGYDSHFIMQQIGKFKIKINAIPNNMERYMAFMISNLIFIDSFQFMSQSLDSLAKNIPEFKYISEEFDDFELLELLKTKGVYPYDYMDSFEKFEDPELPPKKEFYSILNDTDINDSDYEHAQRVWKKFKCKTMGEYHDLYLKTDVLLLADVFENFRKICLEYYKLDPCHYFSSPGLAWDAMLKMTGIKLDLISDIDMHLFIEKGLRGGISYIANRYSKANNKYMKDYDKHSDPKYIMYLDANNLYGWAMSRPLPSGNFKWVTEKRYKKLITRGKTNFILECDLEYPEELHALHDDYPLAPEKIVIPDEWLSKYSLHIKNKFEIPKSNVRKLVPTLLKKQNYVLHHNNLELYTQLGLKVSKIHRILTFDESPWLKKYIDFNTQKRTKASNSFEKDFFKLMNNSVFGKTMENLRKRINIKLTHDESILLKDIAKPSFVRCEMFNENLFGVHKIKESLLLNRPTYVGMCILDLSKYLMYDFHYNYIKLKYKHKATLLFTDTDSLCYEILTEDAYKDFYKDKDLFDNSDYSPESKFYFDNNKKVIGKFKDEASGVPIVEFVGLRSKMYSYLLENEVNVKKCKGIKKNVVRKQIVHQNYKETLFNKSQEYHTFKTIRSDKHNLASYIINKTSLSCYDDKRYILDNGIKTLAYGYDSDF